MNSIRIKKIILKAFGATVFFLLGFLYAEWQMGMLDEKWDRIELIGAFQFIVLLLIVELMIFGLLAAFGKK